MSLTVVQAPSPNKSSRSGSVRLIVLHISAGATSNENLAPFLQDPSSQVSYHVSVDNDPPNTIYKYVDEAPFQSWSCASYNGVSVNGCICVGGEAVNWSRQQWLDREGPAIASLAQWVAKMASLFSVPLAALSATQAQGTGRGVCQHRDLGQAGGGHSDCGVNFPMDELLAMARGDQPAPQPPPEQFRDKDENMGAITEHPHVVPVPAGAKNLVVASDIAAQNVNHVVVNMRFHYTGEGNNWQQDRADLVVERPFKTYSMNGRDVVSMTMEDPNLMAGYSFS